MKSDFLRLWFRRGLKFLLFAIVVVVTLLVLAGSVISYQGRREWAATKRELLAKGEKLSLVELAPPGIPDEMNFFADPLWEEIVMKARKPGENPMHGGEPAVAREKQQLAVLLQPLPKVEVEALRRKYPLFAGKLLDNTTASGVTLGLWGKAREHDATWRGELVRYTLDVYQPAEPVLDRVVQLLERPAARFPVNYEEGFFASLPHITALIALGQAFQQRAYAELQLGQSERARRDALAIIGLSHTVRAEPLLISYLVRSSLLSMAAKVVETGVGAHAWSDEDLVAMERALREEDLLPGLAQSLRGERGGFNAIMETLRSGNLEPYGVIIGMQDGERHPSGWLVNLPAGLYLKIFGLSDQAYENRYTQKQIEMVTAWPNVTAQQDDFAKLMANQTFRFTHLFSALTIPTWLSVFNRAALTQTIVVQARIACALERYYLKHLEYPKTLEALVPEYLSAVPVDIVNGQPMHYERTSAGAFKLWSIGVDGKDDQGRAAEKHRLHDGDWVWGAM